MARYFLAAREVYKDEPEEKAPEEKAKGPGDEEATDSGNDKSKEKENDGGNRKAKISEVVGKSDLNKEALSRWVKFLKPSIVVRGYLNEWESAPDDKLASVAQGFEERFQKRFDEWREKLSKWRPLYRAALAENKLLPKKPIFEAGDDRFFNDVYFNGGPFAVKNKDKKPFSRKERSQLSRLRKEQETLKKSAPLEPDMACAIEEGDAVGQRVFIRGDYNSPGEDAPKSFPAILARYDTKPSFTGSGRLQFADWLTQPTHPLTARVMVNRIWQWHFGDGLVRTPDNFGRMGDFPTHPELLDYMASQFVKNGWSVKAMHRMIMLSSAYQMSSVNPNIAADADPDNRLLTRFNRRRLSVEEMRDGLLAIDGTIDFTVGGSLQKGRGTDGENNQGRLSLNPENLKRRTVYLPLRRANLPTLLNLFDFGDATTESGKRQLTNVATQALFWLNSEFLNDRAQDVAKSLLSQKKLSNTARIETAYARILNRRPDGGEAASAEKYVDGFKKKFPGKMSDQKAWQSLCRVLMSSNDFVYVD